MSTQIIHKQNFFEIEERVKKELKLSKSSQLVEILGIPYPTYSTRKRRKDFAEEWIIYLHLKYNLQINWLLNGSGEKYIKAERSNVKFNFLKIIDDWVSEIRKEQPEIEDWFIFEFKRLFPEFMKWLERREAEKQERKAA